MYWSSLILALFPLALGVMDVYAAIGGLCR